MNSDAHGLTQENSPAHAAITLLIDLAQRREIDPWDVDVIKVIDRFFQDLEELNQTHLPQSGQAFLWASMLVSLKADTLEALATASEQEVEAEALPPEESTMSSRKLPQKLEQHIRRRGSAPVPQKRRVTLSELITYLRELGNQIEESSEQPLPRSKSRSSSKQETAQMISHLAHNENLTELATELEQFLGQEIAAFNGELPWLSLEEVTTRWQQQKTDTSLEASTEKGNRVGIFWALLLLSAQSKVELSQEEFYQDLKLRFLEDEMPKNRREDGL